MPTVSALSAPIVYLGPSMSRAEAADLCPGAEFRAPIRRGDLYRDRERGGSVFLLLDGLFFNNMAVPPREIVDVIGDGGLVAGAASIGAIRAAECWPAGMRGVGSIFRLYRRGVLISDDEVAVVCDAEREFVPLSVPLINVRYALSRSVRQGALDRERADRIAEVSVSLFYADRTWPKILSLAGFGQDAAEHEASLSRFDLKKRDAARALRALSRWLVEEPDLLRRPRRTEDRFVPSERSRERRAEPFSNLAGEGMRRFAHWQIVSGRYRRHLLAVAVACSRLSGSGKGDGTAPRILAEGLLSARSEGMRRLARKETYRQALARATALRFDLQRLGSTLTSDKESFAAALWAELAVSNELEAELFRFRAVHEAASRARQLALEIQPRDRRLAEAEIAHEHGFRSWSDLEAAGGAAGLPWAVFLEYREELALAKVMRRPLFGRGSAQASSSSREAASTISGVSNPSENEP